VVGDEFIKFYVCMYNKWNPYSEEINSIPPIYWILAFNFIQTKSKYDWEHVTKPHAELIGQLTHPEIYTEYKKIMDRKDKKDSLEKGKDFYEKTRDGIAGGGSANAIYDPKRGLVDEDGNIIISKDKYEEMTGIAGIAISY